MTLRDALCMVPADPHMEQIKRIPYVLIFGGFVLTALLQLLDGVLWLRRLKRAVRKGKHHIGTVTGCEYMHGARYHYYIAAIRLDNGKEFFSPRYETGIGLNSRYECDVYCYHLRRYIINFRPIQNSGQKDA